MYHPPSSIMRNIMIKHFAFVVTLLVPFLTQASNLIDHPSVSHQKNCFSHVFSDYASWRQVMSRKYQARIKDTAKVAERLANFDAMFGEKKFASYQQKLACITFEYPVDGHQVKGFAIKPKQTDKPLPVLVFNRGGNGNYGGVVFGTMMAQLFPLAEEGFVIVGSQYRGTFTKSDTLDQFGGEDVNDVTALLDILPAVADADVSRVGMFGASRGGMQTHLAVKKAKNIKAIAILAGVSDLSKGLTRRPDMKKVYRRRIPNYEDSPAMALAQRSVLTWVEELSPKMPILLLHGTADKRVAVEHSELLANALKKNSIPHKLVLYPDDNHSFSHNRKAMQQELVSWFKQHL